MYGSVTQRGISSTALKGIDLLTGSEKSTNQPTKMSIDWINPFII